MFCKNCGTMLRDDAKFCASCGTPVSKPVTNQQMAPNTNPFNTQSPQNTAYTGYNQNPYQSQQAMNQGMNQGMTSNQAPNMYQNANTFSPQLSQPVQTSPFNAEIPTPVIQTPIMEAPVMQTPVIEAPVMQTPVMEAPVMQTPVMEAPVMQTPVIEAPVMQTPVMQTPFIEAPVIQTPVMEAPVMQTPVIEAPVIQTPVMEAPVMQTPVMEAPVMQTPVMEAPFMEAPVIQTPNSDIYQTQNPFNNNFNPQQQNTNAPGSEANQWGPLMTPKKKSKLPIILILLFVACAIIASAFLLIKTFILGNSPEDALESILDAASTNKSAELFDNAHPIFNDMLNELKDSDLSDYADQMESSFMESVNPELKKFSYSDLVIKKTEMKQSELDTLKSDMKSAFKSMKSMDSDFSLDISNYDFEEGYELKGTLKIDDEKYEYESTVVKTDGKWYIFDISIY